MAWLTYMLALPLMWDIFVFVGNAANLEEAREDNEWVVITESDSSLMRVGLCLLKLKLFQMWTCVA